VFIFIALSGMAESFALSFTYLSPDHRAMKRLASVAEISRSETGTIPSGWEALEITPNAIESEVRVKERYVFLPVRVTERRDKAEIFFITRRPFRDVDVTKRYFLGIWYKVRYLTPPMRYALAAHEDGRITMLTLSEEEVQRLFREQKVALPTPDRTPEREWVTQRTREMAVKKAGMAGAMLFGGLGAWMLFRRSIMRKSCN
jgi:hypothetical protein